MEAACRVPGSGCARTCPICASAAPVYLFEAQGVGSQKSTSPRARSRVPNHRGFRVSILGTVIAVLGRYLIVGYLDPLGLGLEEGNSQGFKEIQAQVRPLEGPSRAPSVLHMQYVF